MTPFIVRQVRLQLRRRGWAGSGTKLPTLPGQGRGRRGDLGWEWQLKGQKAVSQRSSNKPRQHGALNKKSAHKKKKQKNTPNRATRQECKLPSLRRKKKAVRGRLSPESCARDTQTHTHTNKDARPVCPGLRRGTSCDSKPGGDNEQPHTQRPKQRLRNAPARPQDPKDTPPL